MQKEILSPIGVQNKLQDWFRSDWLNLRETENAAAQLAFRYQKEALFDTRCGTSQNFHLPQVQLGTGRFDIIREAVDDVIEEADSPDKEGLIVVPASVASYALSLLIAANAKEEALKLEPLCWFIQGDFEAIDLSTQSGRGYLLYYYLKARGAQGSDEEFEQFCAWCQNNEQEQEEDNSQEEAA